MSHRSNIQKIGKIVKNKIRGDADDIAFTKAIEEPSITDQVDQMTARVVNKLAAIKD